MALAEAGKHIGILGGGQLGRMLVEAGIPMQHRFTVVDPTPKSPAAQVGAEQIIAPITDADATRNLARLSDVTTIEIEHVNAQALQDLYWDEKRNIQPSPETLLTIIDKVTQKDFLRTLGIPVAEYQAFYNFREALEIAKQFGPGFFVKVRQGGFDGRGNMQIYNKADLEEAFRRFEGKPLFAEKRVKLTQEIAVLIARDSWGDIVSYPAVEMFQDNGICDVVIAGKGVIDPKVEAQAVDYARVFGQNIRGAGVFAIEAFVTDEGQVVFNEIAPRVHNSYHLSIEANKTSQFKQHLLGITGEPLEDTGLIVKTAVMKNLLTGINGGGVVRARQLPGVFVHLYGKDPRPPARRKVGHITAIADTTGEALRKVRFAHRLISTS